ncbi:hypothetical protein KSP40_PGU020455 [Platanthera guangdongensis]|uniref:Uncharacterized protein n=1 Tax=Platanthera guangdongensis TaxID=2320717 RepID=A0ABR2MN85_9ASPA
MLVTPKLSTLHGYKNQLLEVEEITSTKSLTRGSCAKCFRDNGYKSCTTTPCIHGRRQSEDRELNPKLAKGVPNNDGAFVGCSRRFMITDDLNISILSAISAVVNGQNLPIYDVVEKEVFVDKYTLTVSPPHLPTMRSSTVKAIKAVKLISLSGNSRYRQAIAPKLTAMQSSSSCTRRTQSVRRIVKMILPSGDSGYRHMAIAISVETSLDALDALDAPNV